MKRIFLLAGFPVGVLTFGQNYTSYFTGNPVDITTQPDGGVCLMGGATEDDNAMTWFLEQANGGDILVIRASGSDGYNDYFYTDLGVTVNSVESIVFNDASAADEAYIHQKIAQAEAIWMAGGDQWNYVSYWRDTPIDSLINAAISDRKIVIGGTSAGMAVLGEVYFTAENGTVTSATSLNNPYAPAVTVDNADFLKVPFMENVITDTHYDNPDRRGRHVVFMARAFQDLDEEFPRGIACEEYVAVCVDTLGIARVYGGWPAYDEQAYFIRRMCDYDSDVIAGPSVCMPSTPLDWMPEEALTVYKVNGTSTGANYFDLNAWEDGAGGEWQGWWVENGVLNTSVITQPYCVGVIHDTPGHTFTVYPNPASTTVIISSGEATVVDVVKIYDLTGRLVLTETNVAANQPLFVGHLKAGVYVLESLVNEQRFVTKISIG